LLDSLLQEILEKLKMSFIPYVGISELTEDKIGCSKSLLAELIGTMLLVLIGCGSCIGGDQDDPSSYFSDQANIVRISLAFGVAVASIAQSIGHVSGCHINPAVTSGLIAGGKIGVLKGLLYILCQSLGAILGAATLSSLTSPVIRGGTGLGVTGVSESLTAGQAFGVEFLISFVLVLVVYGAAADSNNDVKGSAPLAIGLSITCCHLWAIPLTGSSMNPARSLGPSVITGQFTNHWLYWVAPCLGGITAGLLYQLAFQAPPKKGGRYEGVATA